MDTVQLMNAEELNRTFLRFAHQFLESYEHPKRLAIIGMQTRGVFLAKRIVDKIKEEFDIDIDFGVLDVTFYRDDFRTKLKMPEVKVTEIPFDLYDRDVILVDDVLYTGRTVRSAMDALMAYGRPRKFNFAVWLIEGTENFLLLLILPDNMCQLIPMKK